MGVAVFGGYSFQVISTGNQKETVPYFDTYLKLPCAELCPAFHALITSAQGANTRLMLRVLRLLEFLFQNVNHVKGTGSPQV